MEDLGEVKLILRTEQRMMRKKELLLRVLCSKCMSKNYMYTIFKVHVKKLHVYYIQSACKMTYVLCSECI